MTERTEQPAEVTPDEAVERAEQVGEKVAEAAEDDNAEQRADVEQTENERP